MIRKSALGSIRFAPDSPLGFGDFVVWFQMAETCKIGHIREKLWSYRIHPEALSDRSIIEMSKDYDAAMNSYFATFINRYPDRAHQVGHWRANVRRYLFWALLYEICRYSSPSTVKGQTIFDIMGYRLTPEAYQESWALLRDHQKGFIEAFATGFVDLLYKTNTAQLIGWMAYAVPNPWLRTLLRLR